jgi:uncharacterized membrane protein YozB (DUF420 family)
MNRLIHYWALVAAALLSPMAVWSQSPTHIDQGTTDKEVFITEDLTYVAIVVAFLILLVAYFFLLRKRVQKRAKRRKEAEK